MSEPITNASRIGWQCPRCFACLSPDVTECMRCAAGTVPQPFSPVVPRIVPQVPPWYVPQPLPWDPLLPLDPFVNPPWRLPEIICQTTCTIPPGLSVSS